MAKRLYLIGILAAAVACGTTTGQQNETGKTGGGGKAAPAEFTGWDATERALMSLGVDGRVQRADINDLEWPDGRFEVGQAFLLDDLLVLESSEAKPRVLAVVRNSLNARWTSRLQEPTRFPVAENGDSLFFVSAHYLHALDSDSGRRSMQFVDGDLAGLRRPALLLPFTPTGGAAGQSDTVYVPSLGSPSNNKKIESFSLITGQRGWGYRASGDILTTPVVGGGSGDPKLYFVTTTGLVTCLDAQNYGFAPNSPRWEELLEAGVRHDLFLTPDSRDLPGAIYAVDNEGIVYCLDRITGRRRWVNATGRRPTGSPRVFGPVCVVPMADGLAGFDADNVLYTVTMGNETKRVRRGDKVRLGNLSFEVSGEVLLCSSGETFRVNSGAAVQRANVPGGATITAGKNVVTVTDRGSDPLWTGLQYERIVCRIGDNLVAANGNTLQLIDAWTGEVAGDAVEVSGARIIATNTRDANVFVTAAGGMVYAFYPR